MQIKSYDDGQGGIVCRTEITGRMHHAKIVLPWINDLNGEQNLTVPLLDTRALHQYFREGIILSRTERDLPGGSQQLQYFLHLPSSSASVFASEFYVPVPQRSDDARTWLVPNLHLASLDLYVASASMDNTDCVLKQLQDRVLHPEKYIQHEEDDIPF